VVGCKYGEWGGGLTFKFDIMRLGNWVKNCGKILTTEKKEVLKMAEGRCMKCKKQVEIKDAKEIEMKGGRKALQGVCPTCGTKVFRILGKK
jgi:DNA-directed RNA polymerase subunit RPC12/RpoP